MTSNRAPWLICFGLASAVVQFCPPAWAASAKGEAVFLGGTIHTIQPGVRGTLEFHDSQEVVFRSGSPAVRLPYTRIQSFHLSDYRNASKKVAGLRVPSLKLMGHDQVLELSFRDQDGVPATMAFRIPERARTEAEALLSERIAAVKNPARNSIGAKLPGQWWGDKYWKTTRNKAAWPEASAEPSPSLAGTK